MSSDPANLDVVDSAYLTRLLYNAGYPGASVDAFQRSPVGGKSHGGGALYRFRLALAPTSAAAPVTLILKEV